jgi:hypothetical protein
MIYVAIPYGNPDNKIVIDRVVKASTYCARLLATGRPCISAIVYGDPLVRYYEKDMKADWEAWKDLCTTLICASEEFHVLMVDGWKESKGVQAEIDLADELGLPITYIKESEI